MTWSLHSIEDEKESLVPKSNNPGHSFQQFHVQVHWTMGRHFYLQFALLLLTTSHLPIYMSGRDIPVCIVK